MSQATQCDVCAKVFLHRAGGTTFVVQEYPEGIRPVDASDPLDVCSVGCLMFYAADMNDRLDIAAKAGLV